jgi:hypothetical protein
VIFNGGDKIWAVDLLWTRKWKIWAAEARRKLTQTRSFKPLTTIRVKFSATRPARNIKMSSPHPVCILLLKFKARKSLLTKLALELPQAPDCLREVTPFLEQTLELILALMLATDLTLAPEQVLGLTLALNHSLLSLDLILIMPFGWVPD